MKRMIAILLSLCLLLSLAACSKAPTENPTDAPNTPAQSTDTTTQPTDAPIEETEQPYVEQLPPSNALDAAQPIPADTGTLALEAVTFDEAYLKLNLPEGVSAYEDGESVCVSDDAGVWILRFTPYIHGINVVNNADNAIYYGSENVKTDWSRDLSTSLAGFPTRVWANNTLAGWLNPSNDSEEPAVDIVMDYGETLVGPWYGMHVRLEAQNPQPDTNIYELLYLRHVRAVLNNFEPITTPDGVTQSAGGITMTFPARWKVLVGDNGFVTNFNSATISGGINIGSSTPANPAEAASRWEGQQFTWNYDGRDYEGLVQMGGEDEESAYYSMYLFSEYSDSRCLSLFFSLRGFTPEDYFAYLEDDTFLSVLASMEVDPNGYRKPGTADADGFETDHGSIVAYSGGNADLEVPAEIGGMDTIAIGPGAFAYNTELTSIVIPEGVTTIGLGAFEGCTNLQTIVLPDTLMTIEPYAFAGCTNLTDVVLPESVTYVGTHAFGEAGCGSFSGPGAEYAYSCFNTSTFETITIADGAELSGDSMFSYSTAREINLPSDLTALGSSAFSHCEYVDFLTLPDTVQEIGPYCFTNMGYLDITLSNSLEVIPEGCFGSTNLDVLVVPESVQRIEGSAIYDAAYVVLTNPAVELGDSAIDCDYLYIEDADQFVFPDEMVIMADQIYLDGVYSPAQLQGDLSAQWVSTQVNIPMDATEDEAAAMDAYLNDIGLGEICWFGTSRDFIPAQTRCFELDGDIISGYSGNDSMICLPTYVMGFDDPFWYTTWVGGAVDGLFAGSDITAVYFPGNYWKTLGAGILEGCASLKDIWFTTTIVGELSSGYYGAETFAGIPDGVIVHLPESLNEDQRAMVEQGMKDCGLTAAVTFEYYSLR